MGLLKLLLIAASVAAAPQVELSTLADEEHRGALVKLDAAVLTLTVNGSESNLPVSELLGVKFTATKTTRRIDRKLSRVVFADGSRFGCSNVTATGRKAVLESPQLGKVEVPRSAVISFRFDSDSTVDDAWRKLHGRRRKRDLLVIKKKGEVVVLDYLEGIVGAIGKQEIKFLFSGDEIAIQRDKAFGVIYADQKTAAARPVCEVLLNDSGRLKVDKIAWDGTQLTAALSAGGNVNIALDAIAALDFSFGKIRYLSQLDPRETKYTPFFDIEFKYRRDKNLDGDPLRLGDKTFKRGLCIHSKTILLYRINTDYRRFKAVIGIDYARARDGLGDVHVVISDATNRNAKKVLFEADVRGADKPRELDLDVSKVRDLEILVDFGGDLDIADWLNLADARVTK